MKFIFQKLMPLIVSKWTLLNFDIFQELFFWTFSLMFEDLPLSVRSTKYFFNDGTKLKIASEIQSTFTICNNSFKSKLSSHLHFVEILMGINMYLHIISLVPQETNCKFDHIVFLHFLLSISMINTWVVPLPYNQTAEIMSRLHKAKHTAHKSHNWLQIYSEKAFSSHQYLTNVQSSYRRNHR